VQSGDDLASIGWNLANCIGSADLATITDVAGNPLVLTATGTGSSGGIDTTAPATPEFTSPAAGAYNFNQNIILDTPATTGSPELTQYSLDGGFTWTDYSPPHTLGDGEYELVARRLDEAGNVSAYTASRAVEIGTDFPDIVAISCENPDGVYTAGETLTFKVSFDRPVKTTSDAAFMTVGDGAASQMAKVVQNTTLSTALDFKYTVETGDEFNPIDVRGLNLSGVQDRFGNTDETPDIAGANINRPDLRVDASAPQIISRTPAANEALARNGSGDSVITLEFDEPVWVETGTIEVYRYGNWLVPPVMTEDEFAEVYYRLSAAQREALMQTVNGSPALHELTGQPLGPYKKTTHGLVESGDFWIPDTSTKYVLEFERDLDDADIRNALEKAGYHRYEVDVTSYRVTDSGRDTITITLPEPLPDGREWKCVISAGSFRDAGGNTLGEESWRFWSDKTATPVVRVDRYSQGEGSVQPYDDAGTIAYETFGNRDKTTRPRGYVRARIDCETPGAVISYGWTLGDSVTINDSLPLPGNEHRGPDNKDDNTKDISTDDITDITTSFTYGNYFLLGDGKLDTACKYYVAATATKAASGGEPALAASDRGYEGAFKSIILYRDPGHNQPNHPYTRFQGSNIEGGMPTISGFPLRDADPDLRFTKHAYQDGDNWYWHSWEIVSDWYNQSARQNWQTNPNYILNTYGDYLYTYQKTYYPNGPWGREIEP
jgi:hypothetical protein